MSGDGPINGRAWRLRGAIGAGSLVVIGFLGGLVTDRLIVAHHEPAEIGMPSESHEAAIEAFRSVLHLRDDQMADIHRILQRHQIRVDEAWGSLRGEIQEGVEAAHMEILTLLTDEQRDRFQEWMAKHGSHGDPEAAVPWPH
jgi:hypothetical protein